MIKKIKKLKRRKVALATKNSLSLFRLSSSILNSPHIELKEASLTSHLATKTKTTTSRDDDEVKKKLDHKVKRSVFRFIYK